MKRTIKNKRLVACAFVAAWSVTHFAPQGGVKAAGLVAMLVAFGMWLWAAWEPRHNDSDKPAN